MAKELEIFDPVHGKGQTVRLWDVFIVGPVMIWGATQLPKNNELLAFSLGTFGVATIVYNFINWQRIEQERKNEVSTATWLIIDRY